MQVDDAWVETLEESLVQCSFMLTTVLLAYEYSNYVRYVCLVPIRLCSRGRKTKILLLNYRTVRQESKSSAFWQKLETAKRRVFESSETLLNRMCQMPDPDGGISLLIITVLVCS
jgi:hypothetical protein